jgi:23S rRNA (adenine1618-N6)-methyltransferase
MQKKRTHSEIKTKIHPRNKHRERYDFTQLIASYPDLAVYVKPNKYGDESVNFFDPKAVLMLNKALLKHFYGIGHWMIPEGYLVPPIPGRADYIHYVADLLAVDNDDEIPKGKEVLCFDIGVGANCIYPIIGHQEYGWSFIGSETDPIAVESAENIVKQNKLDEAIELRLQKSPKFLFKGIIKKDERIDVTICNPPFHASAKEAEQASIRKLSNLQKKAVSKAELNFGGKNNELWCPGGEVQFVCDMIYQSKKYADNCLWFTSLVSKESNLKAIYKALKNVEAKDVRTIAMGQGNKVSRIVAWTFFE